MSAVRPLRLVCTRHKDGKGQLLLKVVFIPILREGERDSGYRLRGQELAEYNAGTGPFAAYPLRVKVLHHIRTRVGTPTGGTWEQSRPGKGWKESIPRGDGQVTTVVQCPRCGFEIRLTEEQLRRLGEHETNEADVSK
jgi:hypothetical protein